MRTDPKPAVGVRPSLILAAAIWLLPTAILQAQTQPDLVVVDQWLVGETVHFTLVNNGTATAKSGHTAGLAVDGIPADTAVVPDPMPPGETYSGSFPNYSWQCAADGSHIVRVRADVYDLIDESNEKNNSREETWICDVTPPKITHGPEATNITQTSATIVWTTNEASDSLVRYSTVSQIYKFSESSQKLATAHKIPLSGLTPDTRYYYVVESADARGNTIQSKEHTFHTLAEPLEIVSGPTVENIGQTQATVLWTTNQSSDSTVRYGAAPGMYAGEASDAAETTHHELRLGGLSPNTLYYFIVRSKNQSGEATSDEMTFRTQPGPAQAPDLMVDSIWKKDHQICTRIKNAGGATSAAGHRAGLYTSERLVDSATVTISLDPDETTDVTFTKFWFECHDAEHAFRVAADIGDQIVEQDETNNSLDWTVQCDITELRIIDGPTARSITTTTAEIVWMTNRPSDSNVVYDCRAGVFSQSEHAPLATTQHAIQFRDLTPGTVYQFRARSAGDDGQTVESKPGYFRTTPRGAKQPKILDVTFEREPTDFPCYRMTAIIEDANNVDKVEFLADGTLLQTDYSPPFQAVLTPGLMDIARGEIFRPWNIMVIASCATARGRWSDVVEPAYECEEIKAEFEYPFPNETFYIPGQTAPAGTEIPIRVRAYRWDTILHDTAGIEHLPGTPDVLLEFTDWPLEEVRFHINTVLVGTVPSQADHFYEFLWDAEGMSEGMYVLRVDAVANDECVQTITRNIQIEEGEPEIEATRQVWREGNAFRIRLNLRNVGTVSYLCDRVIDNVDGLQPISDGFEGYLVSTTPSINGRENEVALDLISTTSSVYDIEPRHTLRVEYYAIPIQFPGPGSPEYEIGEDPVEVIDATGLDAWTISCPCSRTEDDIPLDDEIDSAIEGSDYLIVTNPELCASELVAAGVLSEMARLAYHRNGILGYPSGPSSDNPVWIRACIQIWGARMSGSDGVSGSYLSNGYLLLVGEAEILPSWCVDVTDVDWSGGSRTTEVEYSDLPYGDVASSDNIPELSVGRIIGDSFGAVMQALQAGVYADFDRSYGVATSGDEGQLGNFVGSARDVRDVWIGQAEDGEIMTEKARTHHWTAYVHKDQITDGFDFPMDAGDGFVTGNLAGCGMAAIRVEPDTDEAHFVTGANLDPESTPFSGTAWFGLPFQAGDALTAGDIDGDGEDEIISANIGFDKLIVVCDPPRVMSTTYLACDAELEPWDAIACGQLFDYWPEEMVVVARPVDGGTVDIYEYATSIPDLVRTYRLEIPFSAYDGLVVADIDPNNAGDEIVIGSDDDQRIYVYDRTGDLLMEIPANPYTEFDSLVAGDMDGDGADEMAVLAENVFEGRRLLHLFNNACVTYDPAVGWKLIDGRNTLIYSRFLEYGGARTTGDSTGYDGVTCDDLDGDGKEEICVACEGGDRLYLLDGHYTKGWMDRYLAVLQDIQDRIDVFVLCGHGNPGYCSPFGKGDIATLSLTAEPLVLALSCLTGNYEGSWWRIDPTGAVEFHLDGDAGIAETFFEQGAAVYIGATEVSPSTQNSLAGPEFMRVWDQSETAGMGFRQYRRFRAVSGDAWWELWAMEYNYYGDVKFGAPDGAGALAPAAEPGISVAGEEPLSPNPEIELPDYEIATVDGYDRVTIPGGDILIEPNTPMVPIYRIQWAVPVGVVVQDVSVQQRSDLRADIGLKLPVAVMTIDAANGSAAAEVEPKPGWCPDRQLDWRVVPAADGTATLLVTLYPFEYNWQTTESRFYRKFTLNIETLDSPVRIGALLTDSGTYMPGDPVTVKVGLSAAGEAQDAFVDTVIRQYGSDELVAGLLLDNLAGLSGTASYAAAWDSTGAEPGFYYVETKIANTASQVLARETALFRIASQE